MFLFHITTEAVPIFDPNGQLDQIKNNFAFKESYNNEVEIAVRIMAAVESLNEDEFSDKIQTRYFWRLRTAIMAAAAPTARDIAPGQSL